MGLRSLDAQEVDDRLTDPGRIDEDVGPFGRFRSGPKDHLRQPLGDLGVGRAERKAFEVADGVMHLRPILPGPLFGLDDADRGRVPLLSDIDSDHNAHGWTSSWNARSTSSRRKGWLSASMN